MLSYPEFTTAYPEFTGAHPEVPAKAYPQFTGAGFWDFDVLVGIVDRYLSAPQNLTVARLIGLTVALHGVSAAAQGRDVGLQEVAQALRARGLGSIPLDTVGRALDAASAIEPDVDVLARLSLRDAQRIITGQAAYE